MTNSTEEKKPFIAKKPASPFNVDPYNNRGGKAGKRNVADVGGGKIKPMKVITKKISGGSGGDR